MRQRWQDLLVAQWSLLLALVIALPWGGSGFLQSYDMVAVPHWTLERLDLWGLGSAVPRAVPSDGVVAILTQVVDPALLQKLVLVGAITIGGIGAARLVDRQGLGVRFVAATYALWNPFVAERLVLGQWPVIVALGCLPWIVVAVRDPKNFRAALLTLALAGTALSPVTGLIGLATALIAGARNGLIRIGLVGLLVNAPWIVAGIARAEPIVSDPAGVAAFAVQPEGPLGRLGAVGALGGIWNSEVVPDSRGTLIAAVLVALMWLVMLVGLRGWWRNDQALLGSLAVLAVIGHAMALWGWLAPETLADLVAWNGATAVLRDGTGYLALAVPFHAVALAYGAGALGRWVGERVGDAAWAAVGAALVVALPLAALPDLSGGVGGRVTPVEFPTDWVEAAEVIEAADVPGRLLSLPFEPYRAPEWNDGRTVLDPAGRYFGRETVVSDALTVSGQTLAFEDPRAEQISVVLDDPAATSADLAARGIGLVVIDVTAPGAFELPAALSEAREIGVAGSDLRVLAIDGARTPQVAEEARIAVTVAWMVAGFVVAVAVAATLAQGGRRPSGRFGPA